MVKLLLASSCVIIFSSLAFSQETNDQSANKYIDFVETNLIDKDLRHYSLRLYQSFKDRSFILRNEQNEIRYTPNNRSGLGVGFANSIFSLGMGIGNEAGQDETDRFDFSFNITLKRKHVIGLFFQHYKGYNVVANEDHESIFRDDISSLTGSINYLRLYNSEKLSLTSVMNGITIQTENAYSLAFGGAMTYKRTAADSSMAKIPGRDNFNEWAQITNLKEYGLSLIGQANGIIVFPHNIFLTASFMPGIGLNFQDVLTETIAYNPKEPLTFTLGISTAIGYNMKRFYTTFKYNGIYNTGSLGYGNYNLLKVNKWKFVLGYKLFKEAENTKH